MRIFKHLKPEWFRYGFETLAVIVGILAAFAFDNWNDALTKIICSEVCLSQLLIYYAVARYGLN